MLLSYHISIHKINYYPGTFRYPKLSVYVLVSINVYHNDFFYSFYNHNIRIKKTRNFLATFYYPNYPLFLNIG